MNVAGEFLFLPAYYSMKKKNILLLLPCLLVGLIINSCKKDNQGTISKLIVGGKWQLASVMRFNFVGSTEGATDTLNTNCNLTQFFTFNSDNTCTYTNFDCLAQTSASAPWSLTSDQLHLQAAVVCDTSSTATASTFMPFKDAQIINLGQYSMVLLTGDIQTNYSLTAIRHQVQYGFVRVK